MLTQCVSTLRSTPHASVETSPHERPAMMVCVATTGKCQHGHTIQLCVPHELHQHVGLVTTLRIGSTEKQQQN